MSKFFGWVVKNPLVSAVVGVVVLGGVVFGVVALVSIGKTLCCWDIVITNEDGQRTCTARITCMILADR